MTEVIFENGKRADVLDISAGVVYEVLKSEKEADCDIKTESYPSKFEVRKVRADVPWNSILLD